MEDWSPVQSVNNEQPDPTVRSVNTVYKKQIVNIYNLFFVT